MTREGVTLPEPFVELLHKQAGVMLVGSTPEAGKFAWLPLEDEYGECDPEYLGPLTPEAFLPREEKRLDMKAYEAAKVHAEYLLAEPARQAEVRAATWEDAAKLIDSRKPEDPRNIRWAILHNAQHALKAKAAEARGETPAPD